MSGCRRGTKVPARPLGIGPRPRFLRVGIVTRDGGYRAMDANSGSIESVGLAECFSRLWENGLPIPDVFDFLAARPAVPAEVRIGVLLEDQHQRWRRGQPLPLRVYLSAFPDIAERGELIRALVDRERHERRRSAGRLNQTIDNPTPSLLLSESDTVPVEIESSPLETQGDRSTPGLDLALTGINSVPADGLRVTRDPAVGDETGDRDDLAFALDEKLQLRSEAECLKAMLNAVRFTLVRRLGAGGMGVVFEAYDQQRGELVALKTMRKVDPLALVRFKQEFRSLSDLTHPNLVNLYELVAIDDRWFFTMELVEGCDFVTHVRTPQSAHHARGPAECPSADRGEGVAQSRTGPGTRRSPQFDEARLRDALRQLAEGIDALHQSGKLHRDIKPTNVLVTGEGRVVLLDFGLTTDLESSGLYRSADRQIVGTLAHMSPEQAAGLPITPASDWYSVGVMLFEVLTGELPFGGSPRELVIAKRTQAPPSPGSLVDGLAEDLVRLCVSLLDRDPARRPGGRAIIAMLRGQVADPADVPDANRELPLIGRSRHLRVLDGVFAGLSRGRTESIFVFGRTGTGKTTLIRSFLDGLIARDEAVVLTGRCYERESVPYKALDSLIDSLARHLKGLPERKARALLPQDVSFLARVFPVLQSVEAVALAPGAAPEMPDQQELRRRAFAGLRELLAKIAKRTALVLAIDDLQWGDVDSAQLLSDLLCSPQSPALLFLGSFRSEDERRSPFLNEIRKSIAAGSPRLDHRDLAVEPLTQSEARELALVLLGRDDAVSRAQAHVVARESGGNPLFIDELVKHIHGGEPIDRWEAIGQLDLDEVLWARIRRQPEDAQRLLGVVAVSGRPIRQALAFHASELGAGGRVALASLRTARLIRCIGQTQNDDIEIYHDRIRETVADHLPPDLLKWHHERLALVLSTSGPVDPEVLAGHYRGSGDRVRACEFYARGADQAAAALAFDHAARLYRTALEDHPGPAAQVGVLWSRLGDALTNAGRGAEAAQAYLAAAPSATAADALDLKRLAAAQLLISGHLDEGLALLRTLFGPLGMRMPDTPRRALASMIWHRLRLRLRGFRFDQRDETQVSAMELTRIDLCWSAVAGLSMIEPIRGADFQVRGLLLALRAGEPFRIARAMAMEAAHRATTGLAAEPRVATLLGVAARLAARIQSHHALGMVELVRGISSLLFGRWKAAQTSLDQAEQLFRNHCTGVAWERDTGHNFALWALVQLGEIAELKRLWTVLYREAQERGDLYAATTLTAFYMTIIRLAGNEIPEAEADLESLLGRRDGRAFNLQHSSALDALVHLDLYRGDVTRAWYRLESTWPEYARSLLFHTQLIRIRMLEQRARAAVAMAEKSDDPRPFLIQATRDARSLEREGQGWAVAHARFIRAAIAACEEDTIRSATNLTSAAALYEQADMPLNAQLMRYRLGEVQVDDTTRALREGAERWLQEQGIVSPARWAGMCAPGFSRVSNETTETSF
jgi:eukaryotic-like serine/threonine-protein kinase